MNEATWIQEAREGETSSFNHLVTLYQGPVYNLAYRMLGDRMEAEDAAQEAFLRAYQKLDRYDPKRPFRTWLLSITAHHCVDRLRRRKPTAELNEAITAGTTHSPEVTAVRRDTEERVKLMLDELKPVDRAAVTLYYWYDCSYEEISGILEITTSAVKSRLHRARRTLAQNMEGARDGM